jgi:hypothetical protein
MMVMLAFAFFSWWYGQGLGQVTRSLGPRIKGVANAFSVSQLLQTLFAPWRRIISYPGASLQDRWKAWGDNMFSRVIGFVVRLFVLFAALVVIIFVFIITVVEIVLWPLLPVAVPGSIILVLLI